MKKSLWIFWCFVLITSGLFVDTALAHPFRTASSKNTPHQQSSVSKSESTWDQKMYNEEKLELDGELETHEVSLLEHTPSEFFDSNTGAIIVTVSNKQTNVLLSKLTLKITRIISPTHWFAVQDNPQQNGKFIASFVYPGLYAVSLVQGFKSTHVTQWCGYVCCVRKSPSFGDC